MEAAAAPSQENTMVIFFSSPFPRPCHDRETAGKFDIRLIAELFPLRASSSHSRRELGIPEPASASDNLQSVSNRMLRRFNGLLRRSRYCRARRELGFLCSHNSQLSI
jgi:hypothetical protein